MKTKAMLLAAVFLFTTAFTFFGDAKRFVPLKGEGRASGEATIERMEFQSGLRSFGIDVFGLNPSSIYTVWFVDERGGRAPAGVDTNSFRTSGTGSSHYVTTVYEDQLNQWRYVEVDYHPGGNPKDTASMVMALRGDLVYGVHY